VSVQHGSVAIVVENLRSGLLWFPLLAKDARNGAPLLGMVLAVKSNVKSDGVSAPRLATLARANSRFLRFAVAFAPVPVGMTGSW
jgi:hypothetical protein